MHMRNSIPCGLINEYTYPKWSPIRDQIYAVVQTLFFHSTCRYHLHTFRQEFYYECNWNCARIIVIVQQTKNDLSGK